mmetsp:Transcript_256/g.585  ORF Transcript_256/g.585 Transcript_256/m.585 type:complete len:99 (-) Transcript_256:6-302(-)
MPLNPPLAARRASLPPHAVPNPASVRLLPKEPRPNKLALIAGNNDPESLIHKPVDPVRMLRWKELMHTHHKVCILHSKVFEEISQSANGLGYAVACVC